MTVFSFGVPISLLPFASPVSADKTKTRRQLHGKQETLVAVSSYKKVPIAFGDQQLSARRWLRVVRMSFEHQRLDARQSPLGASQHAKNFFFQKKKTRFIFPNTINIIKIFTRSLPRPRVICMMSVQTVYGQRDGE